ncbi:hypothetical protein Sgly_1827 [Syntrophobotulus glycolicus DSM 8271]|uniref:Lipoprotein n=1 Tax=Syntrophobotulus glycolicus (strain DSM 8271 / FlGlyR) TaxID=645991 RepID=F0T037_SYNGF|nr:hypothetical protein [Syntrophobotulus glycolicus]ADY56124.1 hypothetical protein Sgly_1827 [Syntrophobotulus glycolicus DSM 8271]
MSRILKFLLITFLLFLLTGCSDLSWTTAGKIMPPVNEVCPLEGKWAVLEDLDNGKPLQKDEQQKIENIAQFTREFTMIKGSLWEHPTYKLKKVNAADYFKTKSLNSINSLVPVQEVTVITVSTSDGNFLGEFMKVNEIKIIAFVQNQAFLMEKILDQADSSLVPINRDTVRLNSRGQTEISGVLLGLRTPQDKGFTYQTLWLAADNKKLHQVLTLDSIFFPRNSGFWKLEAGQSETTQNEALSAYDVSNKQKDQIQTENRIVNYIGNDYAVIESNVKGISQLQVLPVDKLSSPTGLKVSDFFGDSDLTAYHNARDKTRRDILKNGVAIINESHFEENFGLARKNGHWYLHGRLNYLDGMQPKFLDFNVNVIPPKELIYYDTLCLNWQSIKDRIPDAADAFTSPSQDIALVLTKNTLYVYGLSMGQLDNEPLIKIKLREGQTVIMAEWATGSYVDNWEKAFLSNGAQVFTGANPG